MIPPKAFLTGLFDAAIAAVDPARVLPRHLPDPPKGRLIVIGAGKGSATMARAFERGWADAGHAPGTGLVLTRYGFGVPTDWIEIVEAAHPVPDEAGLRATRRMVAMLSGLRADDLVVALISGGGSALLAAPPPGLTLADEAALNRALLASGLPIGAMNTIRKHVSTVKGGRLAALAHPARLVSLIVSDVPGDDPAAVASGPTVPSEGGPDDARLLVARAGLDLTPALRAWLDKPDCAAPRPDDPVFADQEVRVIASARIALDAAADAARALSVAPVVLSDAMEGEAREAGFFHAALAREIATGRGFVSLPAVLLSGGETTVGLGRARGRGGRNGEAALGFALALDGVAGVAALMADTDGIDGSEDNAGAFADGTSAARLRAAGQDPAALLAAHRSWDAFDALGDLFVPGPTGTNVNDFRAVLIAR